MIGALWRVARASGFLALTLSVVSAAHGQVTTLSPLAFGTVITGTSTSVAPTSASAANWKVHGKVGIAGIITLTLPSTLARTGGGTGMPVAFCSTCAVYQINNSSPVGGTTFNPNASLILTIVVLSDLYLWLGGSVNPPAAQAPGSYSGTVVITVTPLL
jgi:hypothetical protein